MTYFLAPFHFVFKTFGIKLVLALITVSWLLLALTSYLLNSLGFLIAWAVTASIISSIFLLIFTDDIKNMLALIKSLESGVTNKDVLRFKGSMLKDFEEPLLFVIRTFKHNSEKFDNTTTEMRFSASELTESAEKLAENTLEQSETTTSTAAVITEMGQNIEEVSARIRDASEAADLASQLSSSGREEIVGSRQEVEQVGNLATETQRLVSELAERSKNVTAMSKVIQEIADQTNLLSLNAAIEAARAGEHGRGFAVVAEEVRSLALRSHSSAIEINENINGVNDNMSGVTQSMDHVITRVESCIEQTRLAETKLNSISDHSRLVSEQISGITVAAEQQSVAAREISNHIETVAAKAEENSYMAKQTASVSAHLYSLAKPLVE